MKSILNLFLLLITIVSLPDKSFSLTDYKIKKICKKDKRELFCIKNLQQKRTKLNEGNLIEIPVIPYKK